MIKLASWGACALVAAGVGGALAGARPVARIDDRYPPAEDRRSPDRTFAKVEAGPVALLAYSRDGRTLATAGGDKVVRVWAARTGEQDTGERLLTLEGHKARITALAYAGDPEVILAAAEDRSVRRWEATSGKLLGSATLPGGFARPLFRPGTEPLIAGISGGRAGLWNRDSGAAVRTFEPRDPRLRVLAFAPDGKRLAAASDGGAIRVWDADSGALLRTLAAGAGVRAVAVSGTHLAAAASDGAVKLWRLEAGAAGEGDAPLRAWSAHKGAVTALAFSAKGGELATAGADGLVKVWDVDSGTLLCLQEGHAGAVVSVAFNPNGQKMASGGADRSLRTWTVPLPPIPATDLEKMRAALPAEARVAPKRPRRLLVFWRADAILHKGGVPAANKAIQLLGERTGAFRADFTRDYEALEASVLSRYDALVLNSTAHITIPDEGKRKALLDYVRGGGGVVGIHAAIDMFKSWREGAEIVGATFGGHPWHPSGTWRVKLDEPEHPLLRAFGGKGFPMHDEFYELAEPYARADRRVLMSLDLTDAATAGVSPLHRTDRDFAVSWIKRHGEGRVFYCMFGHIGDPFQNPAVLRYYLDGIQYALGDLPADATPRPAGPGPGPRLPN